MRVEFSQHVKTQFSFNAKEIMDERNLTMRITTQEGFGSKPVAFLFQGDPQHWIICSHRPGEGLEGRFSLSSLPKRHYSIENARTVFGNVLV
jgi:hypothetical protein